MQARSLKEFKRENGRPKKAEVELTLDKMILKGAPEETTKPRQAPQMR